MAPPTQRHGARLAAIARQVTAGGRRIPLASLPPLPSRTGAYWSQPITAFVIVGGISSLLIYPSRGVAHDPTLPVPMLRVALMWLLCLWAVVAMSCTIFIVMAGASEIRRSEQTCYPIPEEVARRLQQSESLHGLENIPGPVGSKTRGTFCVRCFVWRPPGKDRTSFEMRRSHHCSICQRCVTGFDHHCDFFGRCIVDGNMVCFNLTIGMLWAGLLTSCVMFFIWAFCGAVDDVNKSFGSGNFESKARMLLT